MRGAPEQFFRDKTVVVTGGTGTIGSKVVGQLLKMGCKAVRVLTNDEYALYDLMYLYENDSRLRLLVGDVRDKDRLLLAFDGVDYVFHCAALKHVDILEYNPLDAIKTNILGTKNALEAALEKNVDRFLFLSSDKAVNPVSTMGATKLLGEKLTTDFPRYTGDRRTIYSSTRFGNVIGSRGSILETYMRELRNGHKLKVTDERMTRFFMRTEDAAYLMLQATTIARGGEVFVLKMPALRIIDLAKAFIQVFGPTMSYEITGARLGEKFAEYLMTEEELDNTFDLGEMYAVVPERHREWYVSNYPRAEMKTYGSDSATLLSQEEVVTMLHEWKNSLDARGLMESQKIA